MRIAFIITRADTIGGAQVHVRDLTKRLKNRHCDVLVITGETGPYTVSLERLDISVFSCRSLQRKINIFEDFKALTSVGKVLKEFQPDIVSTHSSKAGVLGRIACKLLKIPCVFTAHGWAFTDGVSQLKRQVYQLVEKFSEPLARKIICVSNYDRSLGLAIGMNPDRLITIHNGMPDIPLSLRASPTRGEPVKVIMVARFDQQKDHATLLKACKTLPQVHITLIGDGPTLGQIRSLADQLGLADRVSFLGFRQNVAEFLSQSHIFALISNWEGFPRTTLEAMRAGLPVVVSDVGGAAEAVIQGKTGYCIPKGNVSMLNQRLSQLVDNLELRHQMGCAARERYESEFTFERMFQHTYSVYQEILEGER